MGTITTDTSLQLVVDRYMAGLRFPSEDYAMVWQRVSNDAPSYRKAADTGVGAIPVWPGGAGERPDRTVDTSFALDLDYTVYGLEMRLGKYRSMDSPQLAGDIAQRLGREVAVSRKKLAETTFAASNSTTIAVDSKALVANDHTTTIGTRDNLGTTALDRAALMACIAQSRQWVTYEGTEYDLSADGWYLVVGTTLEDTARQVLATGSSGTAGNYQGATIGGDMNITLLVNHQLNATDWYLVSKYETPYVWWERAAPVLAAWTDMSTGETRLAVDYADAFGLGPMPDGVFGNDV